MTLALCENELFIDQARPARLRRTFTGQELHALGSAAGRARPLSAALGAVLERVRELRGSGVTWACHLRLRDLLQESVGDSRDAEGRVEAPLVFFSFALGRLYPKVVIAVVDDRCADVTELRAMHQAYRGTGIEYMCLQESHVGGDYLYAKNFKRAFYGAFFCDGLANEAVYCPSLRELGFHAWRDLAR